MPAKLLEATWSHHPGDPISCGLAFTTLVGAAWVQWRLLEDNEEPQLRRSLSLHKSLSQLSPGPG
jgi:hypothetical protein